MSPDPAGPSDLPSLEYESYEQIIAAIRAAFPVRRSGVLPGVYGTLAGKPGPVLR